MVGDCFCILTAAKEPHGATVGGLLLAVTHWPFPFLKSEAAFPGDDSIDPDQRCMTSLASQGARNILVGGGPEAVSGSFHIACGQIRLSPEKPRVTSPVRSSHRSQTRSSICGRSSSDCGRGAPRWTNDSSRKVPYSAPEPVAAVMLAAEIL